MSGAPQPYAAGNTGTLADVVESGPELQPVTPAGPDGFKPPPSFGELVSAARPGQLQAQPLYDDVKLRDGYAPIVAALGLPESENPAAFNDPDVNTMAITGTLGRPSDLATSAGQGESLPFGRQRLATRQLQEQLVVKQLHARRLKDPGFLSGVPDTVEGLHEYFEQQQASKRAAGAAVLGRGSSFGRTVAELAGGGVEQALHNPWTLPSLAIGGGTASSVIQAVGRDALINGVLTAGQLPTQVHNMAENDEHLTPGEAVGEVAGGAIFGGLFGGAIHLAGEHVPPLLFKAMPESVQTRWASRMKAGDAKLGDVLGDMDNRELATFSRTTIGDRMTPDEKGAADTLERSQELGEASPFTPGPAGDAAHNASLADALKGVIDGADRAPLLSSTALGGTVAAPPIERLAVPEGRGFDTQWSAIKGNEHGVGAHGEFLTSPKGAVGPAQVMPGTAPYAAKLAGLAWDEARYRGDAGYNEALGRAYYAEQLRTFGDPDKAAAAYNAGPGSAERGTGLRGAMRKAVEHGEPENWEKYLPLETQRYVADFRRRTGAVPSGAETVAAPGAGAELGDLDRQAADAEDEALQLSQQRDFEAADMARDHGDVADVPVLKRELFPSDEAWADAQAAFHQSLNAPEEPAAAPLSAETASGPPDVAAAGNGAPGGLPNTRGKGLQFHGARGEVPELTEGYYNPNNIYGGFDTFYTTDALDVAAGYGRRMPSARVYRTAEREPVRSFDMEQAVPVADLERLFGVGPDDDGLVPVAIDEAAKDGRASLRDVMDEIRAESRNEGHSKDDVQEIFDTAIHNLREQGFGAMTHIGGLKTGREPHAVKIYFAAASQLELTDVGSPHAIRIDEPALRSFDEPGGEGAKDQVASLEHDARMDVGGRNSAVAAALLDRLTKTGRLPRAPMSLIEFLSKRGGVNDVGGDLKSMGLAQMRGRARAGERKLINPRGPGIDDAFTAAIEAGYFPELNRLRAGGHITYGDLPDLDLFREAIDRELRGEPVYADEDRDAVFERARAAENADWLSSHVDDLQELASEWDVALDEGTLEHALTDVANGTDRAEALANAIHAAAMRDLGAAVADTGDLRYGTDNEGRPWDEEVNYAEYREPAANDRAAQPGERRPAAEAANPAPGGTVPGEHEGAAGPQGLDGRRYRLDENSEPQSLSEILEAIDRDREAAAALRDCAEGNG